MTFVAALLFAIPTALSAFLLFVVQPIAARTILTWFGGGPAVWTTCLLFFQAMLLIGYAYAHQLGRRPGNLRLAIHLAVLIGACVFLPLTPSETFKPVGGEAPIPHILGYLALTLGIPYFALSATMPLVQRIAAEMRQGKDPYRLTALSNAASLGGLLAYPFVVEPFVPLAEQRSLWSYLFVGFVVSLLALLVWARKGGAGALRPSALDRVHATPAPMPRRGVMTWIVLAAFPSLMLAAVTNEMCIEVAPVPLLWVLPLVVYLATFVFAFEFPGIYVRPLFGVMLVLSTLVITMLRVLGPNVSMVYHVAGLCFALFACAMSAHGELARRKPAHQHLTLYHFAIALGGVLGTSFVALVAPLIFTRFHEIYVGLLGSALAVLLCWLYGSRPFLVGDDQRADRAWLLLFAAALSVVLITEYAKRDSSEVEYSHRDFYGSLRVMRTPIPDAATKKVVEFRELRNGRIQHGLQFLDPKRERELASYYGSGSGVFHAVADHPKRKAGQPIHIGCIGLGIGTVAAFGGTGDRVRFYELSPQVKQVATERFTYLKNAEAKVEIVIGDARLSLERELEEGHPQGFDVLIVDAFSSDSIPRHLLTLEALDVYRRHLAAGGILAIHISNQYLDLRPVVIGLAQARQLHTAWIQNKGLGVGFNDSKWVLMSDDAAFFEAPAVRDASAAWPEGLPVVPVWTDDYSSLWRVVKLF